MRDYICFYINGKRHEVRGDEVFKGLSEYLRYDVALPGTKVVCAEGDCGACTVLVSALHDKRDGRLRYRSLNSCISFLYLLDLHSIITVEGIEEEDQLHQVQSCMRECHGAQCGYCTPGFICAMAGMTDELIEKNKSLDTKRSQNFLTGNLCRCTGYEPILKAADSIDLKKISPLFERYHDEKMLNEFEDLSKKAVDIKTDARRLHLPVDEASVLNLVDNDIRITSGATDLGVLVNKGKIEQGKIISLGHIKGFKDVEKVENEYHVYAKATWSTIEKAIGNDIPEYARLIRVFASPQIKNKGTLIGNVANASPIGDGIPFLMVSGARVEMVSKNGERQVELEDFFLGYKKIDVGKGEYIRKIILPIPRAEDWIKLYKVCGRKDLDISAVTFAGVVNVKNQKIENAKLAYGGVGPVVLRVSGTETFLHEKPFNRDTFKSAASILENEITPMSDLRGTKEFRMVVAKNLLMKFYDELSREKFGVKEEVRL